MVHGMSEVSTKLYQLMTGYRMDAARNRSVCLIIQPSIFRLSLDDSHQSSSTAPDFFCASNSLFTDVSTRIVPPLRIAMSPGLSAVPDVKAMAPVFETENEPPPYALVALAT